jgi:hypothetical protein
MAEKNLLPIEVIPYDTIQEFFDEVEKRRIGLVKVADQGLVQPAKRGSAIVMQPMVRVVATAFDYKSNKILRWDDTWDVGSGVVSLNVTNGQGRHNDPTGVRTRDKIILECQKRGLQVVRDDEWTREDITDTLAGIGPRAK